MKRFTDKLLAGLGIWLILFSSVGFGHAHLLLPIPRTNENIKVGPCGAPPGPVFGSYTEGGTLTVRFNEFVKYTGFFGAGVSKKPIPASDSDFTPLANPLASPDTNPFPNYFNPAIHIFN